MIRSLRSTALLAVVPLLATTLAATPAEARSKWMYKSSETTAEAEWVEWGELPGVEGNAHVGYLEARGSGATTQVWGKVFDYQCDEGEYPGGGGGGGGHGKAFFDDDEDKPPKEGECDFTGKRKISRGTAVLSIDKKLTAASLTGNLRVENHGAAATPPVNMTWAGIGGLYEKTWIEEYDDGTLRYYSKYERTSRAALVTGFIGIMDFTDDADDESYAWLARTKSFERGMSR
ncbi:hypothetical protein [Nocardioides sp.]|uniref:hypothetical protein n=1 Tax=Nocardioides sp. TaxID=35761 RepID=UPI00273290E7|nr:hypothetical protein [Nocardioides sp.]MDP3891694.1 hypothetical protein [Nocardioides sp.]